jgi:hypothetical protein
MPIIILLMIVILIAFSFHQASKYMMERRFLVSLFWDILAFINIYNACLLLDTILRGAK